MEDVKMWSVTLIQEIQAQFRPYEKWMVGISQTGDASYVFGVIFPLLSVFSASLAGDALAAAAVTEWLSVLLKWLLKEDRPFWWIRERTRALSDSPLLQDPTTCETSAGSPSSHVALFTGLIYLLVNMMLCRFAHRMRSDSQKTMFTLGSWNLVWVCALTMSTARLYSAAHFPHQCGLAAMLGVATIQILGLDSPQTTADSFISAEKFWWRRCTRGHLATWTCLLGCVTFLCYWLQKAAGLDPQWSTKMAFKWCERHETLSVSTTPIFCLARDFGLGLGLAAVSPRQATLSKRPAPPHPSGGRPVTTTGSHGRHRRHVVFSGLCVLGYCSALNAAQAAVPTHNTLLFYVCHCLLYATVPYVLVGVVPSLTTTSIADAPADSGKTAIPNNNKTHKHTK